MKAWKNFYCVCQKLRETEISLSMTEFPSLWAQALSWLDTRRRKQQKNIQFQVDLKRPFIGARIDEILHFSILLHWKIFSFSLEKIFHFPRERANNFVDFHSYFCRSSFEVMFQSRADAQSDMLKKNLLQVWIEYSNRKQWKLENIKVQSIERKFVLCKKFSAKTSPKTKKSAISRGCCLNRSSVDYS